jgi:1,2-diacylglycerol 3-beta-glucosyltransferase
VDASISSFVCSPKPALPPLADESREDWPYVSLLVAAKNEEAVIARFVESICNVDYPIDRYEVWAIDDHSSDGTPLVLEQLTKQYPQLKVFRRGANASGGKSGALNQVLPLTRGEFVGVFDADATVTPDLLRRVLPVFDREKVGAVQVRKAIANASVNFWTRGQEAEMALDSFFQQQRIAIGGIGELRGNGQFMRRNALERCGGWNEETITDDLDLTVRLHLDRWDIEFLAFPAVSEEGVTNARALWHQRNRWAEGGYQRYLDYWRLILPGRMGTGKTWDLFGFWVSQYFLPTVALPDFLMSIVLRRMPIASPLTFMTLTLSVVGMFVGLRRTRKETKFDVRRVFATLLQTLRGTVYMFHWLLVGTVTARIAVRPKRLKWVKTVHQGADSSIK